MLEIKYQPAKKEIKFARIQGSERKNFDNKSVLKSYENMKGKFILQDQGNKFFDDIAHAFDGEKEVKINLITTNEDFEDFKEMVEYYYNAAGDKRKCRFSTTLLAELPDMNAAFEEVKKHGENSIKVLFSDISKFSEISDETIHESVKKSIQNFSEVIKKEISNIKEKIEALEDNNVNICFSGVYSSGKSKLINSILGYPILPESIKSETAKMVRINSPKKDKSEKIIFSIEDNHTEIEWDNSKKSFVFICGPNENEMRKKIQDTIDNNKDKKQYEQIKNILKLLNDDGRISSDIDVDFPVAIDNDKVQFTIFDTPGTDSNEDYHKIILQEALSNQMNSILIFIASPDRLEGEGNNALLSYLKEAQNKDTKTSIDIDRSLFVINKIDSVRNIEDRKLLKDAVIKQVEKEEPFIINLSDRKLFFTSAEYAYAAKSVKNNIETDKEKKLVSRRLEEIKDEDDGRYYQHNHFAKSENATEKMIKASEKQLNAAPEDIANVFHVCSGLYALECEISKYGEKYASAVKTFAIIDTVDKTLSKLTTEADVIKTNNNQKIEEVENEINKIETTVKDAIKKSRERYSWKNNEFPKGLLQDLYLDHDYLEKNIYVPVELELEKVIPEWYMFKDTGYKILKGIKAAITDRIDKLMQGYKNKRKQSLEKSRDEFKNDIINIIQSNGEMSDEAKKYICEISEVEIEEFNYVDKFTEIYNKFKSEKKGFLWITYQNIDKKKAINEIMLELKNFTQRTADDYKKSYKDSLDNVLDEISKEFNNNLNRYSATIKSLLDDKDSMEKFRERITESAESLTKLQNELDEKIWDCKGEGN